jgi:hypothetical protein
VWKIGGALEAVFLDQVEIIPLVEDLAADVRIETTKGPYFAVLFGDELLAHRGDLYEEVVVGKVEVGSEILVGPPFAVPGDGERPRLILPGDSVEIEERGKLALTVMSELMRDRSDAGVNLIRGLESQEPSAARWTSRSG